MDDMPISAAIANCCVRDVVHSARSGLCVCVCVCLNEIRFDCMFVNMAAGEGGKQV